jgi:ABC-type nitrate/sulfonate/bicarbonate transport system permease component
MAAVFLVGVMGLLLLAALEATEKVLVKWGKAD